MGRPKTQKTEENQSKNKIGKFLNKIGITKKRVDKLNGYLDILFWIALVLGAYWYGSKTGTCENIQYACQICGDAIKSQGFQIIP